MSIINDALKKVQTIREHKNVPSEPPGGVAPERQPLPAASPRAESLPPAPAHQDNTLAQAPRPRSPLLPIRLIIVIPILILVLLSYHQFSKMSPPTGTPPPATTASPSDITLNGIMTMGDRKVALINDDIYEIGDMINGMTLIGISADSVQVLKDGKILTHKVKR